MAIDIGFGERREKKKFIERIQPKRLLIEVTRKTFMRQSHAYTIIFITNIVI